MHELLIYSALIIVGIIIGIGLGYGYRGVINRIGKKFEAPLLAHLSDVKTVLDRLYEGTETDVAKIKAELMKLSAKIGSVL